MRPGSTLGVAAFKGNKTETLTMLPTLQAIMAALAVSRWIENTTRWSIRKFVRTARRHREVQIQAGAHTITAADPVPEDLRETLRHIHAEPGRIGLVGVDSRTGTSRVPGTATLALRSAGIGALAGVVAALLVTYRPPLLEGTQLEEALTPLVVFSIVLVPLSAGASALLTILTRSREPRGKRRSMLALSAFLVLVAMVWQIWAVLTGAPRLF